MKKLLSQIAAASLGLWLATSFVSGVKVTLYPESNLFGISLISQWQIFLVLGIILGLINFFVKPIIKAITLPLRMLTLGAFSLAINMFLIWLLDKMFEELSAPLWLPLLWATLIIVILDFIIRKVLVKNDQ